MTNKTLEKNLTKVLRELKTIRRDMSMILPTEKLSDYRNSASIKASFKRAMKKYPPKV